MAHLCRTCLNICEGNGTIVINDKVKSILTYCVPELDLSITENPVLCVVCNDNLEIVYRFKSNCIETQKKLLILARINTPNVAQKELPIKEKVNKISTIKVKLKTSSPPKIKSKLYEKHPVKKKKSETRISQSCEELSVKPEVIESHVNDSKEDIFRDINKTLTKAARTGTEIMDDDLLGLLESSKNVQNSVTAGPSTSNCLIKIDVAHTYHDAKPQYAEKIEQSHESPVPKSVQTVIKKFTCAICKKQFETLNLLTKHKKKLHSTQTKKTMFMLQCQICPFQAKFKIGLNKHVLTCHNKYNGHICFKCERQYKTERSLNKHLTIEHQLTKTSFSCNICPFLCATRSYMKKHVKTKHPDAESKYNDEYKCTYCDFKGTNKQVVRIHMSQHTKKKGQSCEICSIICPNKLALKSHLVEKHGASTKFKCKRCQFSTSMGEALERHEEICCTNGNDASNMSQDETESETEMV